MKEEYKKSSPVATEQIGLILFITGSIFVINSLLWFYAPSILFLVIGQLFILLLVWTIVFRYRERNQDVRLLLLTGIFTTVLGPFGAGIVTLCLLLYSLYGRGENNRMYEQLWPEIRLKKSSILYDRLIYGMEDFASREGEISYRDIMSFGSDTQKRASLDKINKYYHPELYPVLASALMDKSNMIRVYAATTITHLDSEFYNQLIVLEAEVKELSHNPDIILNFAQFCDRYYSSKILDIERAKKIVDYAIQAYQDYLQLKPNGTQDVNVRSSLARLYLEEKNPTKALEMLESFIFQQKFLLPEVYFLWMQTLFELKDYNRMRQVEKMLPPLLVEKHHMKQLVIVNAVHLWVNGLDFSLLNMKEKGV